MSALARVSLAVAPARARSGAQRRASSTPLRATKDEMEFCREKVSTPKAYEGKSEKRYKVTFVSAGDEKVVVEMPEVSTHRVYTCHAHAVWLSHSPR